MSSRREEGEGEVGEVEGGLGRAWSREKDDLWTAKK